MGEAGPAFEGQRPPFAPGHELSKRHGLYSAKSYAPLAEEIYERERAKFAPWDPAYEVPVRTLAEARARLELAVAYLDEHGLVDESTGELRALLREVPRWERAVLKAAVEMALTIKSRSELDVERLKAEHVLLSRDEVHVLVVNVMRAPDLVLGEVLARHVGERKAKAILREFRPRLLAELEATSGGLAELPPADGGGA